MTYQDLHKQIKLVVLVALVCADFKSQYEKCETDFYDFSDNGVNTENWTFIWWTS